MKCLNGGIYVRSGGPIDHPILVPCGQCIACRLNKARQWSIRCMHEARYHSDNAFVTLTYTLNFFLPIRHSSSLIFRNFSNVCVNAVTFTVTMHVVNTATNQVALIIMRFFSVFLAICARSVIFLTVGVLAWFMLVMSL